MSARNGAFLNTLLKIYALIGTVNHGKVKLEAIHYIQNVGLSTVCHVKNALSGTIKCGRVRPEVTQFTLCADLKNAFPAKTLNHIFLI